MMKNRKFFLPIFVLMIFVICSCSESTGITFEPESLSMNVSAPDDTVVMTLTVSYPKLTGGVKKSVMEKMNMEFYNIANSEYNELKTTYSDEALELYNDGFPYMPYEFDTSFVIHYAKNDILSILYTHYLYTGGVHPYTYQTSQTYNTKTGELLQPDDITGDAFDPTGMAKQLFINDINDNPDDYFENSIELLDEAFDGTQYFLDDVGLNFYINPYGIASYASGIRFVTVPYEVK